MSEVVVVFAYRRQKNILPSASVAVIEMFPTDATSEFSILFQILSSKDETLPADSIVKGFNFFVGIYSTFIDSGNQRKPTDSAIFNLHLLKRPIHTS